MKTHNLKLREEFWQEVHSGQKSFEIRNNDRGFQKGDIVRFQFIDNQCREGLFSKDIFEITYVLSGWGLKENYVAFGIQKIKQGNL